jgi:hypothetical protein
VNQIRDPELRAAVAAAYEAWRRRRDRETGQLEITYAKKEAACRK